MTDLDIVLLTHVHADHALDLPVFVSLAERENRIRPLPLYGPAGNRFAASAVTLVRTLLDGTRGAYRHLGDALSPLAKTGFRLEPHDVRPRPIAVGVRREEGNGVIEIREGERLHVAAAYGDRKNYPALAWRIGAGGRSIVFSADVGGERVPLERLAERANLLLAPHTTAEGVDAAERYSHMPPSVIGRLAAQARAERLVLAHRTNETRGKEDASLAAIRAHYGGPVAFADDLTCFAVP